MITNYFISPHPLLQPFVDHYVLCTSHDEKIELRNNWPASNETSLVFYLANQPYHYTGNAVPSPLQSNGGCVVGLQLACNGTVHFSGVYHTFLIQFKANGFSQLFRMPAPDFVNKLYCLEDVFGKAATVVNDQLQHAANVQQMACCADDFLFYFLKRQKDVAGTSNGITYVSNKLFEKGALLNVEQCAYHACMSVRNFGRRFVQQVGVSPKLYLRLLRFNNALLAKSQQPATNWVSIAYECGYYDQMHMIKDFKEFANINPSMFFKNEATVAKAKDAAAGTTGNLYELPAEKFIAVKRTSF